MDLNKRMLVALVLITVILVVWQMFFFKAPPKKNPTSDSTKIADTTMVTNTTPENSMVRSNVTAPKKEIAITSKIAKLPHNTTGNIDTINVTTRLYRMQITSRGASIINCYVNKYRNVKGDTLNIIKGEPQSGITLYSGDYEIPLDSIDFNYNKKSVEVNGEKLDTLLFSWKNDTSSVLLGYVFNNKDYKIDIFYKVNGIDVDWVKFNFRDGLAYEKKYKKKEIRAAKAFANLGGTVEKYSSKTLKKGDVSYVGHSSFAGIRNTYFTAMYISDPKNVKGFDIHFVADGVLNFSFDKDYVPDTLNTVSFYLGPLDYTILKSYGGQFTDIFDWGWKIIAPISKLTLNIMLFIQKFVHNYGITIIILSVFFFLIFFPLTLSSFRSARKMQELQPALSELKEKYKNNAQKLNQATMGLYKKNGVNPFSGCLPILLQTPVFFALYQVLKSTIELKSVSFLWMKDLTAADPYYILPILMGISMFIQQKFSNPDPKQKYMTYLMPIFMVFIFLSFPAGLTLYYLIYNLLSLLQLYIIHLEVINEKKNNPAESK
ncbi:MAG: membrane protein insertase YidC [Proteobacteria bacterium]|nr:membrane protein insertase YidC [Pseudomonadota bacterium]